ncbi:MAG: PAS domain S-box protein [Candidatus Aminicenantes bacterium]|nr:PAS domain S-box protein [Candidatus Aminicenantes bacterium]
MELKDYCVRLKALQKITEAMHSSLDLEEVFRTIMKEGAVQSLGCTTAFVGMLDKRRNIFEVKGTAAKRGFLSMINKILGFSLPKFSFPADPRLCEGIKAALEGRLLVEHSFVDVIHPLISKKACSGLQKLGNMKTCMVVPLKKGDEVFGGMFLTSVRKDIDEEDLNIIKSYAYAASSAIQNAELHLQTKLAKEALKTSESQLRMLIDNIPDIIYFKDLHGRNIVVNKAYENFVGLKKEEIIGKTDKEILPSDLAEYCRKSDKQVIKKRKLICCEEESINHEGEKIYFESYKYPLFDEKGILKGLVGISKDITGRKIAEKNLRVEKAYLKQFFENIQEGIVLADKKEKIISVNKEFVRLFGYKKREIKGRYLDEIVGHEKKRDEAEKISVKIYTEENVAFEAVRKRKDGTMIDVSVLAMPIIVDGEVVASVAIYRDITERKKAEEQVRSSLEEKEVLLKEIHHRVKNNMQIVSSMLRLQARQSKSEDFIEMCNVGQSRIRSIALIHESLYKSNDFARIDFSKYIEKLMTHLFSIYEGGKERIEFEIDVDDVFLDINKAIPCGLIINELISNSLRHAFPNRMQGKIEVKMFMENGKYILIVKDTGIGFPEELDLRNTKTLGMQLLTDLVKQLRGTIELAKDGATEFKITF